MAGRRREEKGTDIVPVSGRGRGLRRREPAGGKPGNLALPGAFSSSDTEGVLRLVFTLLGCCGVDLSQVEEKRRVLLPGRGVTTDSVAVMAAQQLLHIAREHGVSAGRARGLLEKLREEEDGAREEARLEGLVEYDPLMDEDAEDRQGVFS